MSAEVIEEIVVSFDILKNFRISLFVTQFDVISLDFFDFLLITGANYQKEISIYSTDAKKTVIFLTVTTNSEYWILFVELHLNNEEILYFNTTSYP